MSKTIQLNPPPGVTLQTCVENATLIANSRGKVVTFEHQGNRWTVAPQIEETSDEAVRVDMLRQMAEMLRTLKDAKARSEDMAKSYTKTVVEIEKYIAGFEMNLNHADDFDLEEIEDQWHTMNEIVSEYDTY